MIEQPEIKGTLIAIGGNEDKGSLESEIYTLDFIEQGILSQVVKESGGKDASIVIIPTASSIPDQVGDNYIQAFEKLGCRNIKILKITRRFQSEDKDFLKWIEQADCVMFSGGNQSKITTRIGESAMHHILKERFMNENLVIAGTSAGAMAMSEEMIAGGSIHEALLKGAVKMKKGMGFTSGLIIDSHFIRRGRFGRLAEAVARFPDLMGIGLAEDTGVVIKNGNNCRIIGSGMVILFDPSELTLNRHAMLKMGAPMSMANLMVHVLSEGDRFTLIDRKLEIHPLEAKYVKGYPSRI